MSRGNCTNPRENFRLRYDEWRKTPLVTTDADCLEPCGGNGYIECFCAGDFCVCSVQGEMRCPGCEDCMENDYRTLEEE